MNYNLLKGQTLVEAVAALAVSVIIVAALVGMAITNVRSSNLSRSRAVASQLVSEEIERARVFRDTEGLSGLESGIPGLGICSTMSSNMYFPSSGAPLPGVDTSVEGFQRFFNACKIQNNFGLTEMIEISATVQWSDSAGTHPVKVTTYFGNWR